MKNIFKKLKEEILAIKYIRRYKIGFLMPNGLDFIKTLTIRDVRYHVEYDYNLDSKTVKKLPIAELTYLYVASSSGGAEVYIKETGRTEYVGIAS